MVIRSMIDQLPCDHPASTSRCGSAPKSWIAPCTAASTSPARSGPRSSAPVHTSASPIDRFQPRGANESTTSARAPHSTAARA